MLCLFKEKDKQTKLFLCHIFDSFKHVSYALKMLNEGNWRTNPQRFVRLKKDLDSYQEIPRFVVIVIVGKFPKISSSDFR